MRRPGKVTVATRGTKRATLIAALAVLIGLGPATGAAAPVDVPAAGAFTCDFELVPGALTQEAPGLIERDRIYMSRQPGILFKYIPIRPDPATGSLPAGGRYLIDTFDHARDYADFVTRRFVLDGTQFLDRAEFRNPDCRAYHTIGARDFGGFRNAVVVRMESLKVPAANQRPLLQARWPALVQRAAALGRNSVWLLYDKPGGVVAIVSTAERSTAVPLTDATGLVALETSPALAEVFADQNWAQRFDRTSWVFNTWLPYGVGPHGEPDRGEPSLWPNSPLLPEPHGRDGVCVPSRGENHHTAPDDCTPSCGNGVWDPDEDNRRCPSDVPAF